VLACGEGEVDKTILLAGGAPALEAGTQGEDSGDDGEQGGAEGDAGTESATSDDGEGSDSDDGGPLSLEGNGGRGDDEAPLPPETADLPLAGTQPVTSTGAAQVISASTAPSAAKSRHAGSRARAKATPPGAATAAETDAELLACALPLSVAEAATALDGLQGELPAGYKPRTVVLAGREVIPQTSVHLRPPIRQRGARCSSSILRARMPFSSCWGWG